MTRFDLQDHSYKEVVNTPVRDMVSTIVHEDSVPSWLVNGRPLWLNEAINESGGEVMLVLQNTSWNPSLKRNLHNKASMTS